MSFARFDEKGKLIRTRVVIDSQLAIENGEENRTEQNHKGAVDINDIVAKQGVDRIAETLKVTALSYDTNPYNNFQEMAEMVAIGNSAFESLPAKTRDEFENSAAKYMDFVQNPENREDLIKRGWIEPAPEPDTSPIEVIVMPADPVVPDPAAPAATAAP